MSTSKSSFKLFSGNKLLYHQQNHFNKINLIVIANIILRKCQLRWFQLLVPTFGKRCYFHLHHHSVDTLSMKLSEKPTKLGYLCMYDFKRSHHVRRKCSLKPSDNAIKRVLIIPCKINWHTFCSQSHTFHKTL